MPWKPTAGSRGQVMSLALILLALGALIMLPSLELVQTNIAGARLRSAQVADLYAADGGVEHALWRLAYEPGLAASLTESGPSTNYSLAVGGRSVAISVLRGFSPIPTPQPTPTTSPGGEIAVASTAEPGLVTPGVPVTITYRIQVRNVGTSTVHLEEIGDLLPDGFQYVASSSDGWTSSDPALSWEGGRQRLVWVFSPPLPGVEAGQTREQLFLAFATPLEGVHYNDSWVVAGPESLDVVSGASSPLLAYPPVYDITAVSGGVTIRSRTAVGPAGINIRSWEVR